MLTWAKRGHSSDDDYLIAASSVPLAEGITAARYFLSDIGSLDRPWYLEIQFYYGDTPGDYSDPEGWAESISLGNHATEAKAKDAAERYEAYNLHKGESPAIPPSRAAKDRYVVVAIDRRTGEAERILNADSLGYAERTREVYQNDRTKVAIIDMEEG